MTTTTSVAPVYPSPPGWCDDQETYRLDANRRGREAARQALRSGNPAGAFRAIVETCEAEFKILGPSRVCLPAMGGMRRFTDFQLARRRAGGAR